MIASFDGVRVEINGGKLGVSFRLEANRWELGWQIYDPVTGAFLEEGEWFRTEGGEVSVEIPLPGEAGRYHVYLSPRDERHGWHFLAHYPFVLIDALVEQQRIVSANAEVTTIGRVRRREWRKKGKLALVEPWLTLYRNRRLIVSMVRREITARYRGSVGDLIWTILHPLLLMVTYFFVFGIVLETRFGGDPSRAGFVLYFLAGMLPWLPFSEAVGRAPGCMLENRNFVKKLVFPVETIPVTHVVAGLVTEGFALVVFLILLGVTRGAPPPTIAVLPLLLVPQFLLTLGVCWLLAGLGVFFRDLSQIIGFLLTLVFFLTPICYPEASLPAWARGTLTSHPIYLLVHGYRAVLLEGRAPELASLAGLTVLALAVFLAGHAFFHRLRRTFPDLL